MGFDTLRTFRPKAMMTQLASRDLLLAGDVWQW
jgi:hypothetical protein